MLRTAPPTNILEQVHRQCPQTSHQHHRQCTTQASSSRFSWPRHHQHHRDAPQPWHDCRPGPKRSQGGQLQQVPRSIGPGGLPVPSRTQGKGSRCCSLLNGHAAINIKPCQCRQENAARTIGQYDTAGCCAMRERGADEEQPPPTASSSTLRQVAGL